MNSGVHLIADVSALSERAAGRAEVNAAERNAVLAAFAAQVEEAHFDRVTLVCRDEASDLSTRLLRPVITLDGPFSFEAIAGHLDASAETTILLEGFSLWLGPELVAKARSLEAREPTAVRLQPGARALVLPRGVDKGIPPQTAKLFEYVSGAARRSRAGYAMVDEQHVNIADHGYLGLDHAEGWRYFAKAAEEGVAAYVRRPSEENSFWVLNHHHMKRMIERIDTFCGLEGKRVLEIGASLRNSRPAEILLDQFQVRSYTGLNVSPFEYEIDSSQATLIESDIHDVDFEPGTFDVIFSIAVWEHIPNPIPVLSQITKWLSPGGHHYGTFLGFNGPKGHHIYGGPMAQHIPDWAHLTHTADELRAELRRRAPDALDGDIDNVVRMIYEDPRINRTDLADFYDGLANCGLELLYREGRNGGRILAGAEQAAQSVEGLTAKELSVQGFEFVLRKSAFDLDDLVSAGSRSQ